MFTLLWIPERVSPLKASSGLRVDPHCSAHNLCERRLIVFYLTTYLFHIEINSTVLIAPLRGFEMIKSCGIKGRNING